MTSGMLSKRNEAYRPRRDFNQVAPAGLVCSPAPSDSPSLMCPRDWLWFTRAVITAMVATDVEGSSPGSGTSTARGGPARSPWPARARGRRRSPTRLRAAACAHPMATKRDVLTRYELPDEMALILHTAAGDVRRASIQDLELLCRARGSSLLLVVRSAESALQRCQQDRDRHIQSLRDDDQVLDGPTSPAA
jgi:hypothetical protein